MLKRLAALMAFTFVVLSFGLSNAGDITRKMESLSPGASSRKPTMRDPRQVPVGETKTVTGKVTRVSRDNETIEIETTEGKKRSFSIDPQVKEENLRNIQPGDNVTLEVAVIDGTRVATSVQKQG